MNQHEEQPVREPDRITYSEFSKLDLRIGTVLEAEEVPKADRLLKVRVDVGDDEPRTLLAGMKQWYSPEDITGKKVVVLVNLEPRKIRGVLSDGMLLAGSTGDLSNVRLLTIDGDLPNGSKVS